MKRTFQWLLLVLSVAIIVSACNKPDNIRQQQVITNEEQVIILESGNILFADYLSPMKWQVVGTSFPTDWLSAGVISNANDNPHMKWQVVSASFPTDWLAKNGNLE